MEERLSQYDVVIAGGGPAGSAAAITAAQAGARVLLLERGRYPRQKVCGEFISAESLELLHSLLAQTPEALAALAIAPRIERARVFVGEQCFTARIAPAAASLARYDLDSLLWRAAQVAGVETRENSEVRGLESRGDAGFRIEVSLDANSSTMAAAVMINAAGRSSRLARQSTGAKWIGLKAHFRAPHDFAKTTDLYCFDGGYCGTQPVKCGEAVLINACALVRPERARTMADVLESDARLRSASRDWEQVCDTVTTGSIWFRPPETERNGAFLAGDAAGFIDPFVGDGIAIALRGGSMAGEVAARVARGELDIATAHEIYAERYHAAFDGAFRNARRLRRMLELPSIPRAALIALMKLPGAAEMVVKATRSAALSD